MFLQKNTYRCRIGINSIVTEVFNFNIYAYYLPTNRGTLVVYITQTVYILHYCKYIAIYSIDVIVTTLTGLTCFFLRMTSCKVLNFVCLRRNKNSYLRFHSRFSLIFFYIFSFSAYNNYFWC